MTIQACGTGQIAQAGQVAGRVGQAVGVVHPHAVDQPVGEPAGHLGVAGVKTSGSSRRSPASEVTEKNRR